MFTGPLWTSFTLHYGVGMKYVRTCVDQALAFSDPLNIVIDTDDTPILTILMLNQDVPDFDDWLRAVAPILAPAFLRASQFNVWSQNQAELRRTMTLLDLSVSLNLQHLSFFVREETLLEWPSWIPTIKSTALTRLSLVGVVPAWDSHDFDRVTEIDFGYLEDSLCWPQLSRLLEAPSHLSKLTIYNTNCDFSLWVPDLITFHDVSEFCFGFKKITHLPLLRTFAFPALSSVSIACFNSKHWSTFLRLFAPQLYNVARAKLIDMEGVTEFTETWAAFPAVRSLDLAGCDTSFVARASATIPTLLPQLRTCFVGADVEDEVLIKLMAEVDGPSKLVYQSLSPLGHGNEECTFREGKLTKSAVKTKY
ncbi:hypothetical protein R3P38DRAFT_3044296 [Favolaschia claudopus]|uniref:Uncharacterized protein n=1 Tax=Favolaschia claudopus TaxID=2862362 RepID=A0AAW0A6L8_9AGAR